MKSLSFWLINLGCGKEFSKQKNLIMLVAGLKYFFELPKNLELGLSGTYQAKIHTYDTFILIGNDKIIRSLNPDEGLRVAFKNKE